jgi:hypothetical protein
MDTLYRKASAEAAWRLIPFLILCFLVAFLDRVNVGFAALTMNKELGLTAAMFGFGVGIFFFGYFIFEVPSNLILERVGARRWIARIMISWGVISVSFAFLPSISTIFQSLGFTFFDKPAIVHIGHRPSEIRLPRSGPRHNRLRSALGESPPTRARVPCPPGPLMGVHRACISAAADCLALPLLTRLGHAANKDDATQQRVGISIGGQMILLQLDVGRPDHFAPLLGSSVMRFPKSAGDPPSATPWSGFAGPVQAGLLLVIDVDDVEWPSVRFDACGGTGESFTVSGYYVDTGPN